MKKSSKRAIWIVTSVFVLIGLYAALNQIPPKNTINEFDKHPIQTLFHAIPAVLFLIIGPIQLISNIRNRYPKLHRILGWVFAICTLSIGVTALTIVFSFPYAGFLEQIPITLFAFLFLFFMTRAIRFAKNKNFQSHRKDVLRVFCLGLGASMFRVQIIPLAILGFDPKVLVPWVFWFSFGGMLLICEAYLLLSDKKVQKNKPQLV